LDYIKNFKDVQVVLIGTFGIINKSKNIFSKRFNLAASKKNYSGKGVKFAFHKRNLYLLKEQILAILSKMSKIKYVISITFLITIVLYY
jgi:hypothetical protein